MVTDKQPHVAEVGNVVVGNDGGRQPLQDPRGGALRREGSAIHMGGTFHDTGWCAEHILRGGSVSSEDGA